jgi:uncharacterized protein YbcI
VPETQIPSQSVSAEISRGAVQLVREYTGRGPTKARTIINGETIAIVLADTLTKGERSLVALGKVEHVLETRRNYQRVMEEDLIKLVEDHSGRRVAAMLSDNHVDPDIAVEFFILDPAPGGDGLAQQVHQVDGDAVA